MLSSFLDHWLTHLTGSKRIANALGAPQLRMVDTAAGVIRVSDSGSTASTTPCIVFVPDGPNVIEHYTTLTALLSAHYRVVCFDMPGFGFSLPAASYGHSLDQGARTVWAVLDALAINTATLAFSCANGFYALRAAQLVPARVASLFLTQTPSLSAMHAWTARVVPWPLKLPVLGQLLGWLLRRKAAHGWYDIALPKTTDREPFRAPARRALACGGCFSLAGVVQGLLKESAASFDGITAPCTLVWGTQDRSHRHTSARSLQDIVPHAQLVQFDDCGHFSDLEQPTRYAALLVAHINQLNTSKAFASGKVR